MENKKITISNGLTKDEELEKDFHFDYRAYLEGCYDDKIIPVEETEEYEFCRILTKTPFEDDAKAIYDDLCRIRTVIYQFKMKRKDKEYWSMIENV